MPQSTVS